MNQNSSFIVYMRQHTEEKNVFLYKMWQEIFYHLKPSTETKNKSQNKHFHRPTGGKNFHTHLDLKVHTCTSESLCHKIF